MAVFLLSDTAAAAVVAAAVAVAVKYTEANNMN